MADSFTASLNLRKPEVGAAHDTWGGLAGLNGDLDIIDAIFLATGLSEVGRDFPTVGDKPGVGLRIGVGKVLNVEGTLLVADPADTSAGFMFDASDITAATIRTLKAPDASGTIALKSEVSVLVPTGSIIEGIWATAPAGYVLADGRTIGSATSGASSRAHADCEALFSLVWAQFPAAPIFTFEGVASTRGASAAADFAANKRLTMFDARGRTLAGLDNMGGTAAGVLPGYTAMGLVGGAPTHSLTAAENAGHTHGITDTGHSHAVTPSGGGTMLTTGGGSGTWQEVPSVAGTMIYYATAATSSNTTGITGTQSSGSGTAHNNIQPTVVINIAVKL